MDKFLIDDQLLIDLLLEKNKHAFKFLYDTYSPALHGSIIEIVANKDLAFTVLEEVFITAWNEIGNYNKKNQSIFIWLLHIARRISQQALRSIGSWPDASQLAEVSWQLRKVLQRMEKGPKSVIELTYYQGLSKPQVAQIMNVPLQTVEQLLQVGFQQLRQYLNNCKLE